MTQAIEELGMGPNTIKTGFLKSWNDKA